MTTHEATKLHERMDKLHVAVVGRLDEVTKSHHEQVVAFTQLRTVVQRSLSQQEAFDRDIVKRMNDHDGRIQNLEKQQAVVHVSNEAMRSDLDKLVEDGEQQRDFQKKAAGALIVINALMPIVIFLIVKWIGG